MNMAKILKSAGIFVLCMAMSLALAAPTFAAENAAVGAAAKYYYVNSDSTETYVGGFSKVGTYKAKWDVYNYDETPITAILITGVFEDGKLESVVVSDEATVVNGNVETLENTVTLAEDGDTGVTNRTLKSYLWKSMASLVPLEGVAPAAPTNVVINADTITNSTVDITWDAPADANAIAYYNVYRNGTFVGSTFAHGDVAANANSFTDVGIEHNTTVSYTVTAVDVTGNESAPSEASASVTTDDIARLWFGAAATAITDDATTATLEATDFDKISGYNITPVHIVTGSVVNNSGTEYTTSLAAVSENYVYENSEELGLKAIKFEPNMSRVLATIPEGAFLDAIKAEGQDEIKIVMNYFDYRPSAHTYVDSTGIDLSNMIRYSYSSLLNGTTGVNSTNNQKWYTKVVKVPTANNTSANDNQTSNLVYTDVFRDRKFAYTAVNSSGTKTAATDGKDAMFGIGNSSGNNSVFMSKVEIAMKDYVPYGAVLDFENQGDTQYVELLRRDNFNQGTLSTVTATATDEKKMALKLDNTNNYKRLLRVGFSDSYITSSDNNVILRITYLDDKTDETDSAGLTVAYDSTNGSKTSQVIRRTGTNTWKTAEFFIDNASLSNTNGSLQLGTGYNNGTDWYISRVEVIKR